MWSGEDVQFVAADLAKKVDIWATTRRHCFLIFTALEGFEAKYATSVDFGDGMILRKMNADEKTETVGNLQGVMPNHRFVTAMTNWRLETRASSDTEYVDTTTFTGAFDALITLLRLQHAGGFGFREVRVVGESWGAMGFITGHLDRPGLGRLAGTPALDTSDVDKLPAAWKKLRGILQNPGDPSLSLAIARFNDACYRARDLDELLDLVISLEALLLAGSAAELSYRFAVRGALLLGRDEATFKILRDAYRERNDLVHGVKRYPDAQVLSRLRPVVRALILKTLELRLTMGAVTQREFLERLDGQLWNVSSSTSADEGTAVYGTDPK